MPNEVYTDSEELYTRLKGHSRLVLIDIIASKDKEIAELKEAREKKEADVLWCLNRATSHIKQKP